MNAAERMKHVSPRTLKLLASVLFVLMLVLIYPFQSTVVPLWDLRVVDREGAPVTGINVTQHWQHNLLESVGHEELQRTDQEGRVTFPPRRIRAAIFTRIRLAASKLWREGRQARMNPYSSVVVWGSKDTQTNVAIYEGEGIPPGEVVVSRLANPVE